MATTYDPIATTTLSSAAANITFSSISSAYTDLRIVLVYDGAAALLPAFRFNSDTGSNYSFTRLSGTGSAANSGRATSQNKIYDDYSYSVPGEPGLSELNIFSYAGSTFKTSLIKSSSDHNGSGYVSNLVGLWRSTSAITSITIFEYTGLNYAAGTTATLYGIKNA
jgi:hypothetical protein